MNGPKKSEYYVNNSILNGGGGGTAKLHRLHMQYEKKISTRKSMDVSCTSRRNRDWEQCCRFACSALELVLHKTVLPLPPPLSCLLLTARTRSPANVSAVMVGTLDIAKNKARRIEAQRPHRFSALRQQLETERTLSGGDQYRWTSGEIVCSSLQKFIDVDFELAVRI